MPLTKYITYENGQPPSRNMWLKLQSEKFIFGIMVIKEDLFRPSAVCKTFPRLPGRKCFFLKSGFNDYFGSSYVKAWREERLSSTFYIILMFLLWTETFFLSFSLGILSVVGMISSRREIVLSSDVEEYCTHFLLTGRWRGAIKSKAARGPEKSACRRTIFF